VIAAPAALEAHVAAVGASSVGASSRRVADTVPVLIARWSPWIREASARFGVPAAWISAVMRTESGGRLSLNGRPVVSRAGAIGLMQLMPGTWTELRRRYGLGPDPFAPRDNILAGAAYLKALYIRYGYPNLFAAYNAGPGRLDAHLLLRRPLPSETRAYLAALGQPALDRPTPALTPPPPAGSLFIPLRTDSEPAATPASAGLFIPTTPTVDPAR
jgi:soluble lytic murein transglycosylase-like protein